ncbi:CHASE2 domain-containing protein [Chitinimonas sp. BJB300]|uniref:CHASE2 domain-containing protein n=1 Tax=Chitinimonas sp. BJB300 TaxID=1559339 RepID=UPI0013046515|nr:CHASE2 domain-containing protein [Chitinimonas sp. BJB300]
MSFLRWQLKLADRVGTLYGRLGNWLARCLRHYFYLYLAVAISVFAVVDALYLHKLFDLRQASFDTLVKHRLVTAEPDPDIVILDIDEASLAQLAPELGRWPWPRQVLADVLSQINAQAPRALVFDILFSEPDVFNPDSDTAFDAFLKACSNCYLPWVRLSPEQDASSELKASQIPGAHRLGTGEATIAGILPYFPAGLASGRLGFNSTVPDPDGIIRQYGVYEDHGGVRLPSLPARVLYDSGKLPTRLPSSMLLNWRGKPFNYRYISFADVYRDSLSEYPARPRDEFRNKIIIIGSTAPSLFDIKASPVAEQFPGVEVVATAIDNLKHDDYLRVPALRWLYLLLALVLVWATAWSFYRHAAPEKLARWFGLSQIFLLMLSYASINLSNYYINLLGPVSFSIAYFTLAKLYAFATRRALEDSAWTRSQHTQAGQQAELAWLQMLDERGEPMAESLLDKLCGSLPNALQACAMSLAGSQYGGWRMLEGSLLFTQLHPADQPTLLDEAELRRLVAQWQAHTGLHHYRLVCCTALKADVEPTAKPQVVWQALLAQAFLQTQIPTPSQEIST